MRNIILLVCLLLFSSNFYGQENNIKSKVTLKSGEIYRGIIVLKTDEMIMLTDENGTRYQFQTTDIKSVESETTSVVIPKKTDPNNVLTAGRNNFGGVIDFSGGFSVAKQSFGLSPNAQISLTFGNKNVLKQKLFLGVGIGYNFTITSQNPQTISFLPLFIRVQSTLTKKRTSPYLGMDAGYAFALNTGCSGGSLIKISAGITHKINYKSHVFAGVYAGTQDFSINLTEVNELGTYTYYGKTSMNSFGAKIGLVF